MPEALEEEEQLDYYNNSITVHITSSPRLFHHHQSNAACPA